MKTPRIAGRLTILAARALLPLLGLGLGPACARPNGGDENTLATCQDGVDNDGDGNFDRDDQDCSIVTVCAGGSDGGVGADSSVPPGCGNDFVEANEDCDDGNNVDGDGCSADCEYELLSCGDGVLDMFEECDDGPMNSDVIPNRCRENCHFAECGDMVVDMGEACDSGPANSDLLPDRCRTNCQAPGCGDGVADSGDVCDDGTANSDTAANACRTDCTPPSCGDGVVDGWFGEGCDDGAANGGPSCNATCGPPTCGNGGVEGTESCDGGVASSSCASVGFAGGLLTCTSSCGYDTSLCTACGNTTIEGGEQCDGTNLGGYTCGTVTGSTGTLACDPFCYFDTSGCMTCGNGMVDVGEDCDAAALGGETCISLGTGFTGGTLACDPICSFDATACTSAPCDPSGMWDISPALLYNCNYVMNMYDTAFIITTFTLTNGASTLVATGAPTGFGALAGSSTTCPSGSFTLTYTDGGSCVGVYTLTGTFTGPDSWTGSLEATYTGSCGSVSPCADQLWAITATR